MFNFVWTDVDAFFEGKVVVNLPSTEIVEIKFKSLEMEDQVVRYVLETSSVAISFDL